MVKIKKFDLEPKPKFTRPIILLHPNIPKPLHGVNPRTVMGKEWWDIQRKKTYAENKYCCFACGVHRSNAKYKQNLECHESYNINYEKGEMKLEGLVALCHSCHNFIHNGRMKALVSKGEMTYAKYQDIINHGNKILENIPPHLVPSKNIGYFAEWRNWHLLIDEKKYYGKFANMTEWENYYG